LRGSGKYRDGGMIFNYQLTPWVKRLLIANTVVFVLTWALGIGGFVLEWFSFRPTKILVHPWTPLTYMFLHAGFGHLFMNMIGLFFFGPHLESKWGSREFIRYYLVCGLGGVALSFLFVSIPIIGASAAVYGVLLAFAMTWPNAPIYVWGIFPIQAKWLVGFFVVVTFINAFGGAGGGVAHFAHLGGFAAGFLYLKTDWRASQALQGIQKAARGRRRFAIVPREEQEAATSGLNQESGAAAEETTLDAVDRVLDKISAEGMASLTEQERQLLDQVSKKHRTN
jgi:membrane associated rhomboid family serine protease